MVNTGQESVSGLMLLIAFAGFDAGLGHLVGCAGIDLHQTMGWNID